MKSKNLFILLTFLFFISSGYAVEVTEDAQNIYTKRNWSEVTQDCQRMLMRYFNKKLSVELDKMHIPSFWNKDAEGALLGNKDQYHGIVAESNTRTNTFASSQNINLESLIPTGFIVGLGISGTEHLVVGIGGAALLTLIVVPFEVDTYNKTSGVTTTSYEASWAIGGFGQQGVGVGAGSGLVVRGAIGLIWGTLPDATALQGPAIGTAANITVVKGLGFKGAILFNSDTQQNNVIAMVTYDMGVEVNASVDGSVFYFMSDKEVADYLTIGHIDNSTGTDTFSTADLKAASS